MKCGGWGLNVPKHGSIKCLFEGTYARKADICELQCDPDYSAEVKVFHCMANGGWYPTKSPTCEKDGSLTVIIVPVTVSVIIILLLLGFLLVRKTNRCKSKKRSHDDDVEEANNFGPPETLGNIYMLKTDKRPGTSIKSMGEKQQTQKTKKKQSRNFKLRRSQTRLGRTRDRGRILMFRKKFSKRLQNKTGRSKDFVSRISFPWKRNEQSPNTAVKKEKEADWMEEPRHSPDQRPSSESGPCCCGEDSSCSCPTADEEFDNKPPLKKHPPPRPPSPKLSTKKQKQSSTRRKKKTKRRTSVSSGYSSQEKNKKQPEDRKHSSKIRGTTKNKSKKTEEAKTKYNDVNNLGIETQKQLENSENDYRKMGLVCGRETYHPRYHCVKSYPVKPVHKSIPEEEIVQAEETKVIPVGGAKYFPIKQDKAEIKYLTYKTKKSRTLTRSKKSDRVGNRTGERNKRKSHNRRSRTSKKETRSKTKNRSRRTSV